MATAKITNFYDCSSWKIIKERATARNLKVDRISELPDSICHEILRLLPITEARLTSLLSRRWRLISYSCPFYNFDEQFLAARGLCHRNFPKFVNDTLQIHEKYFKVEIQLFRLSVLTSQFDFGVAITDSLKFVQKRDVKELHLLGVSPEKVLISQSTITILKLKDCAITAKDPIYMPALKTLYLESCSVSDGVLEKFLSNCPSIESLNICGVSKVSGVNISSHKLKSLSLKSCEDLLGARIEAPSLEFLDFMSGRRSIHLRVESSTRKLKLLCLCDYRTKCLRDCSFEDLIARNLQLEKLVLTNCCLRDHTTIRLQRLQQLELSNCAELVELKIDAPQLQSLGLTSNRQLLEVRIIAPNLCRFRYAGNLMNFSGLSSPNLVETEIDLSASDSYALWHIVLKQLLEKFGHCRVLSLKSWEDEELVVPREMRETLQLQLYGVEHLKVQIYKCRMSHSWLLDGLQWSFPRLSCLEIEIILPRNVSYKYGQTAGDVVGAESIWRYIGRKIDVVAS